MYYEQGREGRGVAVDLQGCLKPGLSPEPRETLSREESFSKKWLGLPNFLARIFVLS